MGALLRPDLLFHLPLASGFFFKSKNTYLGWYILEILRVKKNDVTLRLATFVEKTLYIQSPSKFFQSNVNNLNVREVKVQRRWLSQSFSQHLQSDTATR